MIFYELLSLASLFETLFRTFLALQPDLENIFRSMVQLEPKKDVRAEKGGIILLVYRVFVSKYNAGQGVDVGIDELCNHI